MTPTFFSKTDTRPKQRFFKPVGTSTDDSAASAGRSDASGSHFRPDTTPGLFSYRKMQLTRPKESYDDLLERLLRNAENSYGLASSHYLEQLVIFLTKNPGLVNRVPNKFHSNPLELVIALGDFTIAQKLLALNAVVRPENRHLLKKIEHLSQFNPLLERDSRTVIPFRR